ncbi:MAG TPA: IPT/TIG domain-containing protein [Candidatus Acidoferrum sp.]|nr:IPT/TIG domain-containing protein [Candidatus Acidoferrum sp.]
MLIRTRGAVFSTPYRLFIGLLGLLALLGGIPRPAQGAIAFVQASSATPQTPQSTVTLAYPTAQTLGNLNVVIVGWNDSTTTVSSVADGNGNLYALAVGPTVQSSTASQAIYYAKNIAAGANTVTITFNTAARFPDIRIVEYSGLDTVNPLDVSVAAQGNTATSNSGAVTTTNANDLLVGANLVQSSTTGPGSGFTSRLITPDGDILEDRIVTATGSLNATAVLDKVQPWIMQMVAFRAATGAVAPAITSLNPTTGPVGTSVIITGTNFGATQGSSTVAFNSTTATPTVWSATTITVPVPLGATSGNVVVTVGGVASNGVNFTVGVVSSISFVQSNSATPQATVTPVTVAYPLAQTAGNLNVVVVGWNDSTATVSSVTDSVGNSYVLAAVPVVQSSTASQAIYYAKNIGSAGAGANTVTVAFSTPARHPDIRIAEYSGLDAANPLDTSAGAQGNTATSDSGLATTTNANDLLVGANTVQSTSVTAGSGYTSRGITGDGDILEDQVVAAAGSYNATVSLDKVQLWIMQMVAFRAATGGGSTVPNIATLNPTSGAVGTAVTISGSNFGATQGSSTVKFNGTTAAPTTWSATSISVPVPAGATSGGVVVTVGGVPSNPVNFTVTVPPPAITSLNPISGAVGTSVIITGTNFAATQGSSTVTFNGTVASPTNWSATSITAPVPIGATTGNVVVTVGGTASNGLTFTVATPTITSLNPTSGGTGTSVAIAGTNFGATLGSSTVTFNGTAATPTGWSATSITVPVPVGATTGNVVVTVSGVASNGMTFTVTSPAITSLTPSSGAVGTSVLVAGTNLGATQGSSTVTFNGTTATPTGWSATNITVPVPIGATTGNVIVTVGGVASNALGFTVTPPPPAITTLNPTTGPVGTSVVITGTNLGAAQGSSTVTFNGTAATPTGWSATSITVPVPVGATTGNVIVTVGGVASNGLSFTVTTPPPAITSLNPVLGQVGTSVTISGTNFGATQGSSTVTFNGTAATPTSWSATTITAPVPVGATTGNVVVSVGGVASNGLNFTVQSGSGAITLVQHRSKDAGTTSSSTLAFGSNNTSGDWIAVVIRAGHSNQVLTVTDSRGNTYHQAVLLNVTVDTPNGDTLGIFYAENIAAGANTVTVSESINGNTLRFAILEYSGVATSNSLDVTAAAQAVNNAPNTGSVVTTASGDLLLGAILTSDPATYTAGTGFALQDAVPAAPNTKLITEDQVQNATGSASATALLSVSDKWGAGLAAFKAATSGGGSSPTISSLNPTFGVVGTSVTIAGTNFGASKGTSTVTFNGTLSTPTIWSTNSISAPVPTGATTGNVVVTVGGVPSNSVTFTVTAAPPSLTSLNPTSGVIGTSVTISGANFGATQGTSVVTFNGITAAPTSWSATTINAPVPNGATTGNVVATVGGALSNGLPFTVNSPGPSISTLSMSQGPIGSIVTITGLNFGGTQGSSSVTFNGTAGNPSTWSDTSIAVPVPGGATTGNVVVTVGGVPSNGVLFTVTPPPVITSLNPTSGPVGTVVTVTGTNFGPTVGTRTSVVAFNGITARTTSWSDTSIIVPVPAGASSGNVVVSISGISSNGVPFTVTNPPSITSLNPSSGLVGTSVTIVGTSFGGTQGTSTVTFNGVTGAPTNWSDTSIAVPVPAGATSGNVAVTVGGVASNGVAFTVTSASGGIKLVQQTSKDAGTTNSSTLAFPANNAAGNFIAVVVRAGKSGQAIIVSDSRGNTYRQAVLFNMTVDADTIGIFYAENISSGANTVTVADNISQGTLRYAILEYSGVQLSNSLDAAGSAEGTSLAPSSGNAPTAWGGDLILGAIVTANPATYTAGTGFKIENFVPAEPNSKLITEDLIQANAGAASSSASLASPDSWGASVASFKSSTGIPPQPISVSVSPSTASVGTGVGTQAFTANLTNDTQNKGVTWSLSGAGCSGSTCGALSNVTLTNVTYTAPVSIPSPATVTLTATSNADNSKTGFATVTVILGPLSVTVAPRRGSITTSQRQQFTATVFNDPNNAGVTWQVDGNNGGTATSGTISSTGLFTPGTQPGLHTITAVSVTNASASGSVGFAVTDLQGVFTFHNDAARTGQNLQEYALTPSTVTPSTFSQLFACPVDGQLYAQPLYVANLLVGSTTRNVVFLATEHDSVYAFDADSPSCIQLWKTSFLGTGVTTMSWLDTANPNVQGASATNDVFPEIGITSTPVIDPATNTIYVEAKTKETVGSGCSSGTPCYVHRLHALNIATGAEKFGGPVVISGAHFVPQRHFNRPSLLLANNTIYIALGSHGDIPPWYGWVFGYDATTLAQKFVFATSDATGGVSNGASIWDGGAGPAADAGGNIYVATGNGTFDGTKNFSESVLKISPTGTLLDSFTPFNQAIFDANDIDLGSAGVMILPDSVGSTTHPHLAMATGKVAILYLLDQNNLGKFHSQTNQDVQEVVPVPPPNTTQLDGGIYGLPAYWNGNIYTTGQNFPLSQFTIASGSMTTPQLAVSNNLFPPRGATPVVSASGSTNGVVWILDLGAWASNGPAILDAYDASNVSRLLYSSPGSGTGAAGASVKFTIPTVANGKVYVGGQTSFTVYGLLP